MKRLFGHIYFSGLIIFYLFNIVTHPVQPIFTLVTLTSNFKLTSYLFLISCLKVTCSNHSITITVSRGEFFSAIILLYQPPIHKMMKYEFFIENN